LQKPKNCYLKPIFQPFCKGLIQL